MSIGPAEILVISIIALIVLGPEKLPAAIREVVKLVRYLRGLSNEVRQQVNQVTDEVTKDLLVDPNPEPANQSKESSSSGEDNDLKDQRLQKDFNGFRLIGHSLDKDVKGDKTEDVKYDANYKEDKSQNDLNQEDHVEGKHFKS